MFLPQCKYHTSPHFTGRLTFVNGNVITEEPFDPMLKNSTSDKFKEKKRLMEEKLKDVFCEGDPFCSFQITSFGEGSVIANFLVSVATGAGSGSGSGCEMIQQVASQMGNLPSNINGVPLSAGNIVRGKSLYQFSIGKSVLFWFLNADSH